MAARLQDLQNNGQQEENIEIRPDYWYHRQRGDPGIKFTSISELQPGDHITRPGATKGGTGGLFYHHHAIVCEVNEAENKLDVIHFSFHVKKESWKFSDYVLYKVQYKPGETLPVEQILQKATEALGKGGYNPGTNNCEHFATWCVTGQAYSEQVDLITDQSLNIYINIVRLINISHRHVRIPYEPPSFLLRCVMLANVFSKIAFLGGRW